MSVSKCESVSVCSPEVLNSAEEVATEDDRQSWIVCVCIVVMRLPLWKADRVG